MTTKASTTTTFFLTLFFLISGFSLDAQVIDQPKASLTIEFSQSSGTNASGMTYDPKRELYYTLIAGNETFPMEVFDAQGNNVYTTDAGSDMRGIWWNKKTKSVEGNCYSDGGIVGMELNEKGYPSMGSKTLFSGSHQPSSNVCGVFDGKKNIYYFDGERVSIYSRKSGEKVSTLDVNLDNSKMGSLNYTSMIYTGMKKMEIGLLDFANNKIYLINKKDGSLTSTVTLPSSVKAHESFRFGYANKFAFIYSTTTRSWTGYRIFE
jgi:hypothetical protein